MVTVQVRKQGGAAIITIPSNMLKMLNLHIGSELALNVTRHGIIAKPLFHRKRKRYTLKELLKGCTCQNMKQLNKATKWAREGKPKGREIA